MASLTDELKHEVVRRLAHFDPPSDIVRWLKAEEDLDCSVQQIVALDPSRAAFRGSERWRAIFEAHRKAYLTAVAEVPIGNQAFRLNELHRLYLQAMGRKNTVLAASLLEQAAKEVGGIFSNVRTLNMPGGGSGSEYSPAERKGQLAALIDSSFGRAVSPSTSTQQ